MEQGMIKIGDLGPIDAARLNIDQVGWLNLRPHTEN